jgi:3D (Asp-Asp-Asp) domain-containing protein
MTARIIGLATAVGLVVPASLGQVSTTSAAAAQFFVTGYVLRGYTATGTYVHPGTCAVDPRVIPLGTYITISGLGTCHAEDTGGRIIGYRIDVWVPTVAQAYALTGWYTASWAPRPTHSWAPRPTQRVPGSQASQRQSPVPTPTRAPRHQVRSAHARRQHWHSHGRALCPSRDACHGPCHRCAASLRPSSAALRKAAMASIGRRALPAASPSTRR